MRQGSRKQTNAGIQNLLREYEMVIQVRSAGCMENLHLLHSHVASQGAKRVHVRLRVHESLRHRSDEDFIKQEARYR